MFIFISVAGLRGRSHDTRMTFIPERVHSIPIYFSVSVYMSFRNEFIPVFNPNERCSLGRVAHAYRFQDGGQNGRFKDGWVGRFCHVNAVANFILERNSFRNEIHSGIMWTALSVDHSKYSSPLASSFLKTISPNFICLVSCLARWLKWRVSKNHIVRERTSGSWTPNWFSSKMRSISSFARATVAFSLFPLPCFLSSRRLDLRTSFGTLNS